MKPVQAADHITHAVIGVQETINFGISTDPAFFQILSSSLYKNPQLAMVRETLCNAWDAHIDAGQTKKPIEVTLNDNELIIRDFGKGIPHDLIGQIYGVYGGSTKKTDSKQTGSFGLGCKSPFAYVEHFEVTSWNQGVKSIYVMSRSSASKDGTPGITRLLNVPTDQSGLQVKIRIQQEDMTKLSVYLEAIAYLGDMKLQLNNQLVSTINLDPTPGSWTLAPINKVSLNNDVHNKVYVRYGSVVYPMDTTKDFEDSHSHINNFIKSTTTHQVLIIQAKPDSLIVMPNRESLSMQDSTIEALKELCNTYERSVLAIRYDTELYKAATRQIDTATHPMELLELSRILTRHPIYYNESPVRIEPGKPIIESIAEHNVSNIYQRMSRTKFIYKVNKYRFSKLATMPEMDRGLVQTYARMYLNDKKMNTHTAMTRAAWFHKRILKPIAVGLSREKLNVKSSLMMVGPEHRFYSYGARRRYGNSRYAFSSVQDVLDKNASDINFTISLTKLIFFSTSMKMLESNYGAYLAQNKYNSKQGMIAYILPPTKALWPAVHQVFTKLGYTIVDLTQNHDWMPAPYVAPLPKEKAPVIPGKRTLLSFYNTDNQLKKFLPEKDSTTRITKFEYYALLKKNKDDGLPDTIANMPSLRYSLIKPIAHLGIGVETQNTVMMLRKQGIPCLEEYVIRNITTHIMNSPTIAETKQYDLTKYALEQGGMNQELIRFVKRYPPILQHFNMKNTLTPDDEYALEWLNYFSTTQLHTHDKVKYVDRVGRTLLADTQKFLSDIKQDVSVALAYTTLKDNKLLSLLDFQLIYEIMFPKNKAAADPAMAAKTHAILMAAL